jgi:hypothetical protein
MLGILLVTCALFGVAVMLLWNALMPQIFGLAPIGYLQAVGLLALARAIFGGLGDWRPHAHRRHLFHNNKLRERWQNMSDEERRAFVEHDAGMRFPRGFDIFRHGETAATQKGAENGARKENQNV